MLIVEGHLASNWPQMVLQESRHGGVLLPSSYVTEEGTKSRLAGWFPHIKSFVFLIMLHMELDNSRLPVPGLMLRLRGQILAHLPTYLLY